MTYQNIQCIAYVIDTDAVTNSAGDPSYLGLANPTDDINARCQLMLRAMQTASENLPEASPPAATGTTLKVFLAPEFYFRGSNGSYDMVTVQSALTQLQKMVATADWEDWLFAFGSIVGNAVPDTTPTSPKNFAVNTQRQLLNFTLVQLGGTTNLGIVNSKLIVKDLLSGVAALSQTGNTGGFLIGDIDYLNSGSTTTTNSLTLVNYDNAGIASLAGITWAIDACLDPASGAQQYAPQFPTEALVQVQLMPSCGATVSQTSLLLEQAGYLLNSDGAGNGSALVQLGLSGTPAKNVLTPISKSGSYPVSALALEGNQSPPLTVEVAQLFQNGAGNIDIYAIQPVPAATVVTSTTNLLNWILTVDYQINFNLSYDVNGSFQTIFCQVISSNKNLQDFNYTLPLVLNTTDATSRAISINVKNQHGLGYDNSIWCQINLPGFIFEGIAMQFFNDKQKGDPVTCW